MNIQETFPYTDNKSSIRYNAVATNVFNSMNKRKWEIVTESGDSFYVFAYSEIGMKEKVSDEIDGMA